METNNTTIDEGLTSTEASSVSHSGPSSVSTSAQSSASKEKIMTQFKNLPTGVKLLSEGIWRPTGLVVARNVSREQFFVIVDRNEHFKELWLHNGDLIYTECAPYRVHNRLCAHFKTIVDTYNRFNEHEIQLEYDTDATANYDDQTAKAGDVLISNSARENAAEQSPNIVGEISYSSRLSHLTGLSSVYLNDSVENHTELYFVLKLRYPYSMENPELFQMVFILYDRQHMPAPVLIVSCGTLPLSEPVQTHLAELTGITPQDHPDVHRGDGYGGPACTLANAAHPHYTVTLGGSRLVSLNRDGDLPPAVADPDLYALDISLYELQQVAVRALVFMNSINVGHTLQSQQDLEAALDVAAGGAAAVLAAGQVRERADHLCI